MNLFNKMSPANQARIKQFAKEYPLTGGDVMKELKRKDTWLNLSYRSVASIVSALGSRDYSPIFISDLFDGK